MDKRQRWLIFAVVLGSTIIFLDSTVVNVALERIGADLPRSFLGKLEGQTYVYAAYLLSLSALLIPAGAASDIFGRRRVFSVGLWGFAVTSVLCGLAPNIELLVLFRILQGAAGALVVPGALAILTAEFEGEVRGRAFGIWAGGSAAATIAGPLVGGLFIQWWSWRAAFFLNVPLLAAALYATRKHVPESGRGDLRWSAMDWQGAALAIIALGGLVFGVIRGQQDQWRGPVALVALALGTLATLIFPFWMKRSPHPLVPPHLFRSRNFSVTNISTVLIYGGIYAIHFYFPLYLQGTLGYDPAAAGLSALPSWIFLALFSSRFGKMAVKHGPRLFMAAGPALMGLGLLWLMGISPDDTPWVVGSGADLIPPPDYFVHILPGWIVFGTGLVIMVSPLTTALMTSVPPGHAGVASAINNALSRVGPQLASAVIFVAVTASFYGALAEMRPGLDTGSASFRDQIAPLNQPGEDVTASLRRSIGKSSTDAFDFAVAISAGLMFAGALVNALGIKNKDAVPSSRAEIHPAEAQP